MRKQINIRLDKELDDLIKRIQEHGRSITGAIREGLMYVIKRLDEVDKLENKNRENT